MIETALKLSAIQMNVSVRLIIYFFSLNKSYRASINVSIKGHLIF